MQQAKRYRRSSFIGNPVALLLFCLYVAGCSPSTTGRGSKGTLVIAPQISRQPDNQSIYIGQSATLSVSATGTEPLSYDWRRNGVSLNAPSSAFYATPVIAGEDDGAGYTVVVSNAAGSAVSTVAKLTVSAHSPHVGAAANKRPVHR